jgi:hypothetical protein
MRILIGVAQIALRQRRCATPREAYVTAISSSMMQTTSAVRRDDRRRYRRLKLRAEQADEQIGLVSGGIKASNVPPSGSSITSTFCEWPCKYRK